MSVCFFYIRLLNTLNHNIMKKIILLLSLACLVMPGYMFGQYSKASLNGPWITTGGQNGTNYIIFDGAGTINELGASVDSVHPVGVDSVSPSGAIFFQMDLLPGMTYGDGQMLNDTSATIFDTIPTIQLGVYGRMFKVLDPAALAGIWSGTVYDSNARYTRNVQLTVNSSGTITAATGIPLIAGKVFAGRDTFGGYITTTDDSCRFKSLEIGGVFSSNTLSGACKMGPFNNNCQGSGYLSLSRPSSITTISTIDFSVYPNPFTDQMEISVNNTGGNIQADLYDLCGRKVLSQPLGSGPGTSLNTSMLGRGMYMLTLTDSNGMSYTKRAIKN
jgi:hypothetical protein